MRLGAVVPFLLLLAPAPRAVVDQRQFQYVREMTFAPGEASAACAALDGLVFAHAHSALADLRVFAGDTETPYALTLSETALQADPARVLNRGVHGRHVVFDLEMPSRPYTEVNLDLAGRDFVANTTVTGTRTPGAVDGTYLGTFTLFDLSSQNLARNSTLPLSESTFPYLHVDLEFLSSGKAGEAAGALDPGMIRAATVPPSRQAQTVYTTVAQANEVAQSGGETIARLRIPTHVPVERVSFDLGPDGPANFERSVAIRAHAVGVADAMTEVVEGQISRVKMTEHGQQLNLQTLSVPATVGSNAQTEAEIEVAVRNGDDRPLSLRAVRLEMRERRLCLEVPNGAPGTTVAVFYGEPALHAPVYDYSHLFNPLSPARPATLQPERLNPRYEPTIPVQPFTERYPALMWLALLAVIAILGTIALRSARRLH